MRVNLNKYFTTGKFYGNATDKYGRKIGIFYERARRTRYGIDELRSIRKKQTEEALRVNEMELPRDIYLHTEALHNKDNKYLDKVGVWYLESTGKFYKMRNYLG